MKKRLAIVGLTGRMGQEIAALAQAPESGWDLVAGVAEKVRTAGALKVVQKISDLPANSVDVVIDFSAPALLPAVADWCAKNHVRLVSGTTGISDADRAELARAAKVTAVLWAPNMSLGIAVMAKMFAELKSLHGFDFQIEELHHNRKKDKPGGTALFLQKCLKENLGSEVQVPEPLAIRGGGIFGIHKVWAMGEEETITIEHTALNRRVFASGALRAADWIAAQGPGLYQMVDVLRLP
jgi:4-hydroxy-tetrahydrodipicolinate reductase